MRILALTNLYPNPYQPNRATFNRQQLRALAAEHSVSVIAPILWTDEVAARLKGNGRLNGSRRATCDGMRVEHPCYYYSPWILRGWYGWFFQASVSRCFERLRAEFSPDLIFALWAYPDGWAACELARKAGLPVVVKIHGSDILRLEHYPGRCRPTLEVLRKADGIVAVSEDLANRVTAFGVDSRRIRVVYDGIDEKVFHPGPQKAAREKLGLDPLEPIVLFVGNLVPVKGIEVLLQACQQLLGKGHRFVSVLIGEGPLRTGLQGIVKRRGLEKNVRFLGSRPHAELADWYRAATVCVLPSYSEGVPIVLLEACACGTPFVASRVGGIPEIAHLGAHQLVAPGDSQGLAQALAAFLTVGQASRQSCTWTGETPVPPARSRNPTGSIRSHAQAASELGSFFQQIIQDHNPARQLAQCGAL